MRLVEEFYNRTIESIQCGSGIIDGPIQIGARVVWQMFSLLTGTYIFNLLSLFGIYTVLIAVIVGEYYIWLDTRLVKFVFKRG